MEGELSEEGELDEEAGGCCDARDEGEVLAAERREVGEGEL